MLKIVLIGLGPDSNIIICCFNWLSKQVNQCIRQCAYTFWNRLSEVHETSSACWKLLLHFEHKTCSRWKCESRISLLANIWVKMSDPFLTVENIFVKRRFWIASLLHCWFGHFEQSFTTLKFLFIIFWQINLLEIAIRMRSQ